MGYLDTAVGANLGSGVGDKPGSAVSADFETVEKFNLETTVLFHLGEKLTFLGEPSSYYFRRRSGRTFVGYDGENPWGVRVQYIYTPTLRVTSFRPKTLRMSCNPYTPWLNY